MTTIICSNINRMYANNGQHFEQMLAYTLTGEIRTHDCVPFDRGSDIPEYHMSVKSARATLVSANLMNADTFMGQVDEYFSRVASTAFAYVAQSETAYVMNAVEFREFILRFGKWESESSKNGGKFKIRFCRENAEMLKWLAMRAC